MVEICAYYYPGWHDRPGVSYAEWDLVRDAAPYFEGHYQPREPVDGYYDDTQGSTVESQVELATRYGIDAFIFLWYWKRGRTELTGALHRFLHLETPMRFSLMWCWKMPKADLPAVPGRLSELEARRWVETDCHDFLRLVDHCCAHYFSHPGYRRIDGKPVFLLYSVEGFRHRLGDERFREMLRAGRRRVRSAGFAGLHLVGVTKSVIDARNLELDALTGYNSVLDPTEGGPHVKDYARLVPRRARAWEVMSRLHARPYIPSVSVGWDATARGVRVPRLAPELDYPWTPVVVRSTPERFGEFLHAAYDWVGEPGQLPILHLCAWNEWSEGAYLEPDRRFGHRYLATVREVQGQRGVAAPRRAAVG